MRYAIQFRSTQYPDAPWTDMAGVFFSPEGAEARKRELEFEFYDKEWRIQPREDTNPYIGNSGTH